MKKDCNECINVDSSICIYYCKKRAILKSVHIIVCSVNNMEIAVY